MAEKAEKKAEAAPAKADDKKSAAPAGKSAAGAGAKGEGGGGLLSKTPVILGGVMLIEAVVLFAGFKFVLGSAPKPAAGAELAVADSSGDDKKADGADDKKSDGDKKDEKSADDKSGGDAKQVDKKVPVEIPVIDFRAPNKQLGKTFIYDVSIVAVTKGEHQKKVEDTIAARKNLITDRIRTIIAQCDPDKLGGGSEPGLETLRRQVKYQLDEIVGDGLIDEVLVPRCMPFRADY